MSSPTGSKRPEKKLCFTFSLIAIVLAVIATVLRIVSLFFFYDEILPYGRDISGSVRTLLCGRDSLLRNRIALYYKANTRYSAPL